MSPPSASVFSLRILRLITFNAIGFGVVFFLFSYLPAPHDFARAAEYGGKNAVGVWFGLLLALVFYPWISGMARPLISGAVACSLGFAIVCYASDTLLGGAEGPFAALLRGAILGLIIGFLFGMQVFPRDEEAAPGEPPRD